MLAWIYKEKKGEKKKKVINGSKKLFTERPQSLHPPQTSLQLWIHPYWTKEKLKILGIDGKVIPIWELAHLPTKLPGGQGSKGGCTHTRGASISISLPHKQYQQDHSASACRTNACMGERNCHYNLIPKKKNPNCWQDMPKKDLISCILHLSS